MMSIRNTNGVWYLALAVSVLALICVALIPLSSSADTCGYDDQYDLYNGICGGGGGDTAVLTLTATPNTIASGDSSLLSWGWNRPYVVTDDCTIDNGIGSVLGAGTRSVSPTVTTTYTITCNYYPGDGYSYPFYGSDTVTVTGAAAPTASLTANPASVNSGDSSTLTWSSTGATSCTGTGFSTGGATSGSVSTGALTSNASYSVTCTGPGGSVMRSASVLVNTTVGSCTPGQPVVENYDAGYDYLQSEEGCQHDMHERQQYIYEIRSLGSNQYQVWQIDSIYERQANCDTNNIYTLDSNDVLIDTMIAASAPTGTVFSTGSCQGGGGDSYVCSTNDTYQVSYTCGSAVPPQPTNLQYSCNAAGTQATLTWTPGAGATDNYFRFDDQTNNAGGCLDGWYCSDPPDKAVTIPGTSVIVTTVPNRTYNWWVHSGNSGGISGATSAGFSCPAPASLSCAVSNQSPSTGQSVRFTATGGSPSYTWSFSEGGSQSTATTYLDRTYTTPGTYTVTLSRSGMTSDTCPLVTVGGGACVGTAVSLTAPVNRVKSGTAGIVSWNIPSVASGVTSCSVTSSANPGWTQTIPIGTCGSPTNGTVATHAITGQTTFTLTCGSYTSTAVVNVLPVIDEV